MPNLHSHFHPYPLFLSGFDLPLQKEGKAEFFPYEMAQPIKTQLHISSARCVYVNGCGLPVVLSFTMPASADGDSSCIGLKHIFAVSEMVKKLIKLVQRRI